MRGRSLAFLAVLSLGCLEVQPPQEAPVVSSAEPVAAAAVEESLPAPLADASPPSVPVQAPAVVQQQVQVQQQLIGEQVEQAQELTATTTEVRWILIEKRFARLDKEARERGWGQKPPPEDSAEGERYREWRYIAENQSKLREPPKPSVIVVLGAPVADERPAEAKAEEPKEEEVEAEEAEMEMVEPPPPPSPAKVMIRTKSKKAWKPRWKK